MGSLGPEWIISGLSLLLFYMLTTRTKLNTEWLFAGIVLLGILQAIYGLLQYVYCLNNLDANYRMIGSFDNPAGFASALSATYAFALFLVSKNKKNWRIFGVFAIVLFIIAITLSHSRTGMIALIVMSGIWLFQFITPKWLFQWNSSLKALVVGIIMIVILTGIFY